MLLHRLLFLCSSASDRGRFSYFGGRGGPLWQRISYKLPDPSGSSKPPTQLWHPASDRPLEPGPQSDPSADPNPPIPGLGSPRKVDCQVDVPQRESNSCQHLPSSQPGLPRGHQQHDSPPCQPDQKPGTLTLEDVNHHITQHQISVWDYLQRQLQVLKLEIADETAQQLPFDFWGGFVGYLGYELKAECGGENAHQAPTPDAAMFLADRYYMEPCMKLCTADALHRLLCPVFSTSISAYLSILHCM